MVDWVNKDYFTKTNLREIFITDSDVPKYVDLISEINKFSDGRRFGWTTRRREMENYVPYELIEQELKVSLDGYKANWDQCDVPKVLIGLCMQNVTNAAEREKSIKSWLNGSLSKKKQKRTWKTSMRGMKLSYGLRKLGILIMALVYKKSTAKIHL